MRLHLAATQAMAAEFTGYADEFCCKFRKGIDTFRCFRKKCERLKENV